MKKMVATVLNDKLKEIAKRRNFTSFWEAFDFFKLASYSELEALMIASELFEGDIWRNTIYATKEQYVPVSDESENDVTMTMWAPSHRYIPIRGDSNDYDDISVEIFVMTETANKNYLPIYKSYLKTKKYKEIPELESQIKIVKTILTTELAINLFNDGCEKLNYD